MQSRLWIACMLLVVSPLISISQPAFVKVADGRFVIGGKPYYFMGTNYWYGGLLAVADDEQKGKERLRVELDFLKSKGVDNLRVLVGSEGIGQINGVQRVTPVLQAKQGQFNSRILEGLDYLLYEMGKRKMYAVLFLSNNWEWSGGFLQYLNWNKVLSDSITRSKMSWDDLRDNTAKFYSCKPCQDDYNKQLGFILAHRNKYTGRLYTEEPSIMAWELANEPRPMRPVAASLYKNWISSTAKLVKSLDKNHLLTIGTEGEMGTESMALFREVHAIREVDYLTLHIWPKNWSWFSDTSIAVSLPQIISKSQKYIKDHEQVAAGLNKPLVLEEFGLPRDAHSFSPGSPTRSRDAYYKAVFSEWSRSRDAGGYIGGVNFWGFGGTSRPVKGQVFWKKDDDFSGDPPQEEQGLNSVFDNDDSTWQLIHSFVDGKVARRNQLSISDVRATKETAGLYRNLRRMLDRGYMFGHQDALAYGVGWKDVDGKSDVKELTGDYPAVYGWELGNIEHELPYNLDSVPFDKMKKYIREGYRKGGVITVSWHIDNPLNAASSWDKTPGSVAAILPGGVKHDLYKVWLDRLSSFLLDLKGDKGEYIPVLFRPFHELTGSWFWWGKSYCTPAEYKLLWRFTADYLKNQKGIHHLIYVYNTGDFSSQHEFMERYPGDDVVDMVSFDTYQFGEPSRRAEFISKVDRQLTVLDSVVAITGKLPALAETGYERTPDAGWWTDVLQKAIGTHKISYVLAWRNHGLQPNGNWHYYVPKKGDVSEADFKKFYRDSKTLFQSDITKEKLYQ